MYLTIMGSHAYGVENADSDYDVYGFAIPPKSIVFPHTNGIIQGFGYQGEKFNEFQQHHIKANNTEYDFTVYNVVKYFNLCMNNNPNMLDSLFTPRHCVIHSTHVSELLRSQRKQFLHKQCYEKYKGYAYSQMGKIRDKVNSSNPKRAKTIEDFKYDVKFAYQLVRLLNECEQILVERDLDLQRNREQLKSIRRGEWTIAQLEDYFNNKSLILENLYAKSTLPDEADESVIKQLLMNCLEIHYGSLDAIIKRDDMGSNILRDIDIVVAKYRK